MRSWLSWLVRERLIDVALALALGTALATLAEKLVDIPVSALAQHVGRNPYDDAAGLFDNFYSIDLLNVSIGDTFIVYGEALASVVTIGLLAVVATLIVRRRDRALSACPFCASLIPHESRHCAYCGSGIESGEP